MIRCYKLVDYDTGYVEVATIDETDASVSGDSSFADLLRTLFNMLESQGYDPVNHMDGIYYRLHENYNSGYRSIIRD